MWEAALLLKGKRIGPYRVGEQLGRGGMGVVYRATREDGEFVALKVLPPDLAREALFVERFDAEIDTVRRLDHPNIVRLLDAGEARQIRYAAFEYLEGMTLAAVLASLGEALEPWVAVQIVSQVARALGAAHAKQIVHRDIKPGNIYLAHTVDGEGARVVVIDFGVSKNLERTALTQSGAEIGTRRYMAPEQLAGEAISGATDTYGLALTTCELLTGTPRMPDRRCDTDSQEVSESSGFEELLSGINDGADFRATISKALGRRPERRWSTPGIFAWQLRSDIGMKDSSVDDPAALKRLLVRAAAQQARIFQVTARVERPVIASRDAAGVVERTVVMPRPGRGQERAAAPSPPTTRDAVVDVDALLLRRFEAMDDATTPPPSPDERQAVAELVRAMELAAPPRGLAPPPTVSAASPSVQAESIAPQAASTELRDLMVCALAAGVGGALVYAVSRGNGDDDDDRDDEK